MNAEKSTLRSHSQKLTDQRLKIQKLSNLALETGFDSLVRQEREILPLVILHILEIEARKLYLERNCSSLFQYLVRVKKYSAPAAQRRIEAMRLLKSVPDLAVKIENGSINLSQVELINRSMKQKEKEDKITLPKEAKQALVSLVENQDLSKSQHAVAQALDISLKPLETKTVQKDESVHLSITLSKEQYAKLVECKDLAAHLLLRNQGLEIADVIEVLADKFIQSKMGKEGGSAIGQHKQSGEGIEDRSQARESISVRKLGASILSGKVNKTFTPKTRRQVFGRQGCCQYRNPQTQQICGSRFALEIDHKISRWSGGDHDQANLQVLCSAHNKLKFRKEAQLQFL